jgi:hypothetical protein
MLTFFTIPRAFRGHLDMIQRNAIQSWQRLSPACEVILMGDDPGTMQAATELEVRHIPAIDRNAFGTPLVSSIFAEAQRTATYSILCYVNADIILMSDFLPGVRSVALRKSRFLLVGQRCDVDIREPLAFRPGWEHQLRRSLAERGRLHGPTGIDYFVFPRGLWAEIPPFAIGRAAWDNWLIYQAKSNAASVIDLTRMVTVAHQNHDYDHIAGGKAAAFIGVESGQNRALAGGYSHLYTLADADYQLTRNGIRRKLTLHYFYRRLVTLSETYRSARWVLKAFRSILGAMRGEKDSFALP